MNVRYGDTPGRDTSTVDASCRQSDPDALA